MSGRATRKLDNNSGQGSRRPFMNRWFRVYDDLLDDPKVQRLSGDLFKTWMNLLCLASKGSGKLPTIADIAFKLRKSECDAKSATEDLILVGLLDILPTGDLVPHNWDNRQFASDSSAERTRAWRARNAERSGDVTVTGGETTSDGPGDGLEAEAKTKTEFNSLHLQKRDCVENGFGLKRSRAVSARLKRKAEGLGLDADKLEHQAIAPHVKAPDALFRMLIVSEVRSRCPGASEHLIKAALTKDNDAAWGQLNALLVGAD